MSSPCIVCSIPTRKYKCPKCFQRYCSLPCYKEHNNSDICLELYEKIQEEKRLENAMCVDRAEEPTIHEPFMTEDTVPQEKLLQLNDNKNLKDLLKIPELRNFLWKVDTAHNPAFAMQVAMQDPLFLRFADECLKVVEPISDELNIQRIIQPSIENNDNILKSLQM